MGEKRRKKRPKKIEKQSIGVTVNDQEKGGKITALFRRRIIVGVFVFLVSFLVFSPSLTNDFVWDDISYIKLKSYERVNLPSVITKLTEPFTKLEIRSKHFRPILFSSWDVDHEIWGDNPFGFHLSNVIFYCFSVLLFYILTLLVLSRFRVEGIERTAFLSTILFAFFPLHVEPVSFIAGRADVLCSIFFFLALIFHILSFRNLIFVILTFISFYLSLLSKEVAITFPLIAMGLDVASNSFLRRGNILRYIAYWGLLSTYFYMRSGKLLDILKGSPPFVKALENLIDKINLIPWAFAGEALNHTNQLIPQLFKGLIVFLNSYLFYISKLVFPFNLNPFIVSAPKTAYYTALSIITILILCFIAYKSLKERKGFISFCIFWILINLIPPAVVAVFSLALTPLAERFLYISSGGFCLIVGYFITQVGDRMKWKQTVWIFGLALCLFYVVFTVKGQGVWRNSITLWERAIEKSKGQFSVHLNYGNALRKAGKKDEAIEEYRKALNRGTQGGKTMVSSNIGGVYLDKGDFENAEKWYRRALAYDPNSVMANYNLGYMFFVRGDRILSGILRKERADAGKEQIPISDYKLAEKYYELAEEHLKHTLELRRSYSRAHFYLAQVYIRFGERDKAKEHAEKALQSGLIEPFAQKARKIMEMP